ncbi:MAG: metal dependent phosphohydrolase [Sphingobacterium sp.]|jgi:hypothetical protein|nr:metal dependent phosphohydrolase [Sphingobacterium sp.]
MRGNELLYTLRDSALDEGKVKELTNALMGVLDETIISQLVPELLAAKCCKQNHPAHDSDVYDHTIKVVNGLPNDRILRLTALFHDLGKVSKKVKGDDGYDHFWQHQEASAVIAEAVMTRLRFDYPTKVLVSILIIYHDLKVENDYIKIIETIMQLGNEFIESLEKSANAYQPIDAKEAGTMIMELLFLHQLSDLKAHSPEYVQRKLPHLNELIKQLGMLKIRG